MPWWDDSTELANFFDTAEGYAVTATFTDGSADLIFDNAFADDLNIKGTLPLATCSTAAVSTVAEGDTITIDGSGYTVQEKKSDGTGVSVLVLSSQ